MQKRLFLCGPSGCGKNTIIRNALGAALAEAGGFVTERASGADGKLLGFDLLPGACLNSNNTYNAGLFISQDTLNRAMVTDLYFAVPQMAYQCLRDIGSMV